MKKLLILMLALVASMVAVSAIDDTTIMNERSGILVRTYQLQERIDLALFHAKTIVTKLNNYNTSYEDKGLLYAYVTNLTILKNRVTNIPSNDSLAVDQFVEIKKEAITIVQEFRKKVESIIPAGDREELHAKLKAQEDTQLALVRKKLAEVREEKNKIIFGEYMRMLGAEIKGGYLNRTISVQEARAILRETYNGLADIDKQKARERLRN